MLPSVLVRCEPWELGLNLQCADAGRSRERLEATRIAQGGQNTTPVVVIAS